MHMEAAAIRARAEDRIVMLSCINSAMAKQEDRERLFREIDADRNHKYG